MVISGAKFKSNGEKTGNVQKSHESSSINTTEINATVATSNTTNHNSTNQNDNNLKQSNNETLDLADLDLTKLRLTKKDIETLSSITPELPKHYQDQLLAQLPPNQARKLSRTLSMQGHGRVPCVFKRSLSSGRDALESEPSTFISTATISIPPINTAKLSSKCNDNDDDDAKRVNDPSSLLLFDRNSVLRRSISRSRDQSSMHRRSISAIRSEFPSRLSYTGDLRTDYSSTKTTDSKLNRYRLTDYTSIMKPEYYSKLPLPTSKSIAPQKSPSNDSLESPMHRASSQRSSSRYSKCSDLYGSSSSINLTDEKHVLKSQQDRERETQSVLREIRERSRDRSSCKLLSRREIQPNDTGSQIPVQKRDIDNPVQRYQRKNSASNIQITKQTEHVHHTRTKSAQSCYDIDNSTTSNMDSSKTTSGQKSDQTCFSREDVEQSVVQSAAEFTDEILSELIRRSNEYSLLSNDLSKSDEKTVDSSSLKKPKSKSKDSKKIKTKQKSPSNDNSLANYSVDEPKPIPKDDVQSVTLPLPKLSKIARRMSQPQKEDSSKGTALSTEKKVEEGASEHDSLKSKPNETHLLTVNTKSYPNSKLTPPKEVTLIDKNASTSSATSTSSARNAITAVMEKLMEKSTERLSPGKSITGDNSKSDAVDAAPKPKTKKKIKVVKRLIQSDTQMPTESKENTQKANGTSNESSKEASFTKETKSPEKKIKSGFLYTIGQKFEKMRENSKNKEKEKNSAKSNDTTVIVAPTTSTEECKPEEVETAVQTIIIPRIVKEGDSKIIQKEEITIRPIDSIPKFDQHRSRIDTVIRNLRERSVPHTIRAENLNLATESGLLKRAVSVEDMSNGLINSNKSSVNKVLGLFRRIEKEQQIQKQQSLHSEGNTKERPRSGGFVSKMKKSNRPYYTGAKSDTIVTLTDQFERQYLNENANHTNSKIPSLRTGGNTGLISDTNVHANSCECSANGKNERNETQSDEKKRKNESNDVIKPYHVPLANTEHTNDDVSEKERIRNNRKGLVLDLTNEQYDDHFKKNSTSDCSNNNNNSYNFNAIDKQHGKKCNGSNENQLNNNFTGNGNYYPYYAHSHSHLHSHAHSHNHGHTERTNDALTSSYEMNASYSSDNRSLHDDCESTSTFLSPTEERELSAFDNWSACSGKPISCILSQIRYV